MYLFSLVFTSNFVLGLLCFIFLITLSVLLVSVRSIFPFNFSFCNCNFAISISLIKLQKKALLYRLSGLNYAVCELSEVGK